MINSTIDFDTSKFYLGTLCRRGHDFNSSGFSLRYIVRGNCLECKNLHRTDNAEKYDEYRKSYNESHPDYVHPPKKVKPRNPKPPKEQRTRKSRVHSVKSPRSPKIPKTPTRDLIFEILGNQCVRCGYCDPRALQIDHVNGGGNKERKAFNSSHAYYKNILNIGCVGYQILCANCNQIKRHEDDECRKWRSIAGNAT